VEVEARACPLLLLAALDWAKMRFPRGRAFPGRAARGSVAPRKVACRPIAGDIFIAVQGHQLAHRGGAAWSLPLSNRGARMDDKTRNLVLLAALSLFCAVVAWISGYFGLGCVFIALGGVAALEIAWDHWH
jgi:hypothetical protein